MSTPPAVEAIFFAALEKDAAQRAAYLDEACAGDPELRRQVERLLEAHPRVGSFLEKPAVERLSEPAAGPTQPDSPGDEPAARPPSPEGSGATQAEAPDPGGAEALTFLEPSQKAGSLGRLGHYEVLAVVGAGGMGTVYRAFDEKLHRVVAIKLMATELAASATARRRFIREAQAAAAVCHDHVVTIHAVEEDHRPPYLVMQYVEGVSLQEKLDRAGPLGLREVLRIGMQTAAGLAAAHKQGLVHRDVKPANILLENGVERVKITDFGLARAADDASLTQSGVIAGTPQYMSPEQAEGRPVDHRSDLFSLGSVLYACCTGRAPFRAGTALAVLKRVAEDAPRPIREINPDIPDWLAAVIEKLHAKDPAQRFQSADEVAELHSRHLARLQQRAPADPEPRRPTAAPRPVRASGRRWAAAAAVLLVLAAGLGLTEAGGVTHVVATVIRIARPDGTLVVEVEDPGVQVAVDGEDLTFKGAGLQEIRVRPGEHEVRATRDGQPVKDQVVSISRGDKAVVTIRRLPAGAEAAAPAAEPPIPGPRLQPPTHPEATLPVHPGPAVTNYVAFTPDGRTLVVANEDGTLQLWDPATHQEIRKWQGPTLKVMDLAVSSDGQRAATAAGFWDKPDKGGDAQVWDLASGKLLAAYHEPTAAVMAVAFAPGGGTLAVAGIGGVVRLLDPATGKVRATVQERERGLAINALAFTPDGKRLAGAGARPSGGKGVGLVRIWDVATGEQRDNWAGRMGEGQCLRFSPDGRTVAVGCRDNTIHLWDVAEGRERAVMQGHTGIVHSLAFFHGDGSVLVSGAFDGTVKLWYADAGRELATLTTVMEVVLSVALSPDGRKLAAGGGGWHEPGRVEVWDLSRLWPQRGRLGAGLPEGRVVVAPPKPPAEPFVILPRGGKAERPFVALAEAVAAADSGDTVEVRGNGPFVSPPVFVRKALTVRAGKGFSPVIELSPAQVRGDIPLLDTSAPLVLEGLQLRRVGKERYRPGPIPRMVVAQGVPIRAANCRFVAFPDCVAVWAAGSPLCEVRNCEFLSDGQFGRVDHHLPRGGRLIVENNVMLGGDFGVAFHQAQPDLADVAIELTRNTLAVRTPIGLFLDTPPAPVAPGGDTAARPIRVKASGNLLDGQVDVLELFQSADFLSTAKPLEAGNAQALLGRLVAWSERNNVYPEAVGLLGTYVRFSQPLPAGESLADWNRFWGVRDTAAVRGEIRYRGGDLQSRAVTQLEQVTAEDFRLQDGSPGRRAGKDGRDRGADVDLVGPGPAYERWRQTPEYRQWLQEPGDARP